MFLKTVGRFNSESFFFIYIVKHLMCETLCNRHSILYRLLAEKGPARPLGNFADIVYLKEQSFLIQMRDVCTLYAGA